MTYSHEQLKAMCPLSISECSQKHVQSVVAELIETALAQPASVPADGIDYEKLVADAWSLHKYRCGTPTCIAFKNGAEWQAKQAPQQEAQPPGFALVQIAELTKWKSLANSLAVLSLKSERATTAIILKSLIQDAIDAAPSAQVEPIAALVAESERLGLYEGEAEQGGK